MCYETRNEGNNFEIGRTKNYEMKEYHMFNGEEMEQKLFHFLVSDLYQEQSIIEAPIVDVRHIETVLRQLSFRVVHGLTIRHLVVVASSQSLFLWI